MSVIGREKLALHHHGHILDRLNWGRILLIVANFALWAVALKVILRV